MAASHSNNNSLQWMVDAGVEQSDVNWLNTIGTSSLKNHPVAASRVKEIQDRAYAGLLATIVTPTTNYAGMQ